MRTQALALVLCFTAVPALAQGAAAGAGPVACASGGPYEACALRLEPGAFGVRLVRGAGSETVSAGFLGPNLSGAVESSPDALRYARTYERLRTPGFLSILGAGVLLGVGQATGASDEVQLASVVGGLGLTVLGTSLVIRSQRALSRSIWEYNGELSR